MNNVLKGFRDFILRGNVIDLAVAFVIGAAFTALITAFTNDFIKPIINTILGGGITGGSVKISDGQYLQFGEFLNAVITFVLVPAVVYFIFVVPMNKMRERRVTEEAATESELDVLKQIRDNLSR